VRERCLDGCGRFSLRSTNALLVFALAAGVGCGGELSPFRPGTNDTGSNRPGSKGPGADDDAGDTDGSACPVLACDPQCPYGVVQDADGCNTCQCAPVPDAGGVGHCTTDSDCANGRICGFLQSAACAAQGQCFPAPTGYRCRPPSYEGCGCDGTVVWIQQSCDSGLPEGYQSHRVLHEGPCNDVCDTSQSVSFAKDIMGINNPSGGIFPGSCGLSVACHKLATNAMAEDLFLANAPGMNTASDAKASYSAIVGVKAKENPMMDLVAPRDPNNSFLYIKSSGDPNQNAAAQAGCASVGAANLCFNCTTTTPCGTQMPYQATPLTPAELCTLKSWIVQGANNN
jgi:hypothetical protein